VKSKYTRAVFFNKANSHIVKVQKALPVFAGFCRFLPVFAGFCRSDFFSDYASVIQKRSFSPDPDSEIHADSCRFIRSCTNLIHSCSIGTLRHGRAISLYQAPRLTPADRQRWEGTVRNLTI